MICTRHLFLKPLIRRSNTGWQAHSQFDKQDANHKTNDLWGDTWQKKKSTVSWASQLAAALSNARPTNILKYIRHRPWYSSTSLRRGAANSCHGCCEEIWPRHFTSKPARKGRSVKTSWVLTAVPKSLWAKSRHIKHRNDLWTWIRHGLREHFSQCYKTYFPRRPFQFYSTSSGVFIWGRIKEPRREIKSEPRTAGSFIQQV